MDAFSALDAGVGEAAMAIDELIDKDYYARQAGQRFRDRSTALQHYVETGHARNLDPHPSFNTKWYRWQNPSCKEHASPLHHFFALSRLQSLDPSPMIDMVQFKRRSGLTDLSGLLNATTSKEWSGFDGVYHKLADLVWHQRYFREQIEMQVLKPLPKVGSGRRPFLVWLQAGGDSEFLCRFDAHATRNWDLLINWYDPSRVRLDLGDGILAQKGTKFTGVDQAWQSHPEIFTEYEAAFFLDDDIRLNCTQISEMFEQAKNYGLDLFQPSLSPASHCVWPVFYRTEDHKAWRRTNGVEIMMPGMSQRALSAILPLFSYSVSGFGLDLLFARVAAERRFTCGVLNSIEAGHHKPIDQEGGAFYEMLRKHGVNPKTELWYLIGAFDLEWCFYEI